MKQFIYTLRYLGKTKATNIIKVLSLTLGLAMGLVIFAQIAFERSYDRFFKDADRLFRIKTTMSYPIKQADNADAGTAEGEGSTRSHTYYGVFYPTVQTMLDNIPEVEDGTTISYMTAEDGRTYYREDGLDEFPSNLVYADSSFFSTMGIEVLRETPPKTSANLPGCSSPTILPGGFSVTGTRWDNPSTITTSTAISWWAFSRNCRIIPI